MDPEKDLPNKRQARIAFAAATVSALVAAYFIVPGNGVELPKEVQSFLERAGIFLIFISTLANGYGILFSGSKRAWTSWVDSEETELATLRSELNEERRPSLEKHEKRVRLGQRERRLAEKRERLRNFDSLESSVMKWGIGFVGFGTILVLAVA